MAVAASRVSDLADSVELRGSGHALALAVLVASIALAALPPVLGILVILGILS
jgi:hypothetical protein